MLCIGNLEDRRLIALIIISESKKISGIVQVRTPANSMTGEYFIHCAMPIWQLKSYFVSALLTQYSPKKPSLTVSDTVHRTKCFYPVQVLVLITSSCLMGSAVTEWSQALLKGEKVNEKPRRSQGHPQPRHTF